MSHQRSPDLRPAPRLLLVLGLLLGGAAAAFSLVQGQGAEALPPGAVARVGERLILRDEWLKAVAAVSSERRTPLTAADQQRILNRLIDEELLVQHGLALGLVEKDQRLRGELVSEVMLAARSGAQTAEDEQALRAFYGSHADRFATAARLRVVATRLAANGQPQPFLPPLPNALLTPAKLRNYLGPTLTEAALHLPVGKPQRFATAEGQVQLEVIEAELSSTPAFEAIRGQVQAEWQRDADEAEVRRLLTELRASQRVVLANTGPAL